MLSRATRAAAVAAAAVLISTACADGDAGDTPTEAEQQNGQQTSAPDDDVPQDDAEPGQGAEQQPAPSAAGTALDPPDDEIGADVGFDPVLFEGDDVVVALSGMTVYSTGAELRVAVRRHADAGPGQVADGGPLGSQGPGGPPVEPDGQPPDDVLRIAIVYPDGQQASTLDEPADEQELREQPQLSRSMGAGSDDVYDYQLWLRPLPREGDGALRVEVDWPQEGIDSATADIDLADLRAAEDRVVDLWGDER